MALLHKRKSLGSKVIHGIIAQEIEGRKSLGLEVIH